MKIKTQTGETVDFGGCNVPIKIKDLALFGKGGPFAVVAYWNECDTDLQPDVLGIYSAKWMAANALELIPAGVYDDDNWATFKMPTENEAASADWDVSRDYVQDTTEKLFDENVVVDCMPNLSDMKERRLEILTADYLNGQDESNETRLRQNAITNAFNCGVLSFFYWLSDRGFLKNADEIHDLLLSNCTGLFDKVTRGKI